MLGQLKAPVSLWSHPPPPLWLMEPQLERPQRDYTGKMGFSEFKELFTALNGWKQNFMMFDQDRSGTVEPHEMSQAINAMGEVASLACRSDALVAVCVMLRTDGLLRVGQVTASVPRLSTPS